MSEQFLVLIGSYARGDSNERSDCDLLTVGYGTDFDPDSVRPYLDVSDDVVINAVAFTNETFRGLCQRGSLFLFHAFHEGRLIAGDGSEWSRIAADFRVQRDFSKEIAKISNVTERFWQLEKFGGKYLWPLVNAFTLLKNASIFKLAHEGRYVFNKMQCMEDAIKDRQLMDQARLLVDFYDYAVKELTIDLPFDPDDPLRAKHALHAVARSVRGMMDEIA